MPPTAQKSATRRAVIAILSCAVLAAVAIPAWLLRDMMSAPQSATGAALRSVASGAMVDIVVEVSSAGARGAISAHLLEVNTDGTYRRTATALQIVRSDVTRIEMGSPSDVKPGAILAVRGARADVASSVNAIRIVILTGFARVR